MTIKKIRNIITDLIGKKVKIVYYGGRNKNVKYVGVIFMTYSNIFTLKQVNGDIKSFSYIDVLIKTVKIYY